MVAPSPAVAALGVTEDPEIQRIAFSVLGIISGLIVGIATVARGFRDSPSRSIA